MNRNLIAEMKKAQIEPIDLANLLGVTCVEVVRKLNQYGFNATEMYSVKTNFFPNLSYEYLFERTETPEIMQVDLLDLIGKLIKTEVLHAGVGK